IGKIRVPMDSLMPSKVPSIYTIGYQTKKRLIGLIRKSRLCGPCRIRPGDRMRSNGRDKESSRGGMVMAILPGQASCTAYGNPEVLISGRGLRVYDGQPRPVYPKLLSGPMIRFFWR